MDKKYNVSWHTFTDHLQLMFKDLYEEEKHSDVTFVCDDQTQFKAHKIVLRACSPVFKKIIDNNPSQHPLIYLMGVHNYEMESILQFMFLGEGRFYYERMPEFLKVAKDLEVKEISKGVEIQDVDEDVKAEEVINDKGKETDVDDEPKQQINDIEVMKISQGLKIQNVEEDTKKEAVMDDEENETDDDNDPKQPANLEVMDISLLGEIQNVEEIIEKKADTDYEEKVTDGDDEPKQSSDHSLKDLEVKEIGKSINKETRFKTVYVKNTFLIQSVEEEIEKEAVLDDEVKDFYENNEPKQTSKNKIRMRQTLNQMMYPCNQCDYKAKRQSHLKRHIQSKHEGIKYPCNQCVSHFVDRKGLQKHIAKHAGLRFPCDQCDYKAREKGALRKHVEGKHSDNTLQCELCGYQTKWRVHYNAHIKKHETV